VQEGLSFLEYSCRFGNYFEVSMWVASIVVNQKDPVKRVQVVERLITVAEWCRRHNNFNTVVEIVVGLNKWVVKRLLKKNKIQGKAKRFWTKLKKIADPQNNYRIYRNTLKKDNSACTSFLRSIFKRHHLH